MDKALLTTLLVRVIEEKARRKLTPEQYDADLVSLGIDSIVAIDIANELEAELGVVIDDREIYRFRTLNAILAYFTRAQA